jgi:N-methylhydantoinase A
MSVIIGVDIGGTFTDCVVRDRSGRIEIGKAFSTPPNFESGFLASIDAVSSRLAKSTRDVLSETAGLYHGCTVGTNALVQGRTARVGLLATRGHADSIFQMKAGRRLQGQVHEYIVDVANHQKPLPLVPKPLIREIDERTVADGSIAVELNEEQARAAIESLLSAGVEAIAISLLWAIRNDEHERRLVELVRDLAPGMFVSRSSGVVHRLGEYERTVTTLVNCLIGPEMERYLAVLEQQCASMGYRGNVHIMTCSGGLISTQEAAELPVLTIGSGPVAGLIGSHSVATSSCDGAYSSAVDVITADMGGTTFDVGVIHRGVPLSRRTSWHGQYEYWVPTLDVRSVGSGGGSLIKYDEALATLRVGPESAGAVPGPVCVNHGGTVPTVTDANLVVGILDPEYFLGGRIGLDVEAARLALARAGEPLGLTAEQTAVAALRIVDNQMADAIRVASIQQGLDPRGFVLYAYGGGGPMHGPAVAQHVGMSEVIVPLSDFAAGWSAFGISGAQPLVVQEAAQIWKNPFDPALMNRTWQSLEAAAVGRMARQGFSRNQLRLTRHADMRFQLQVNEIEVDAPDGEYADDDVQELIERFQVDYDRIFGEGTGYSDAGFAITGLRVRATAQITTVEAPTDAGRTGAGQPVGVRLVNLYQSGYEPESVSVYRETALGQGAVITGPAVIELPDTTIVVPHAGRAEVDERGNIRISLRGARHE